MAAERHDEAIRRLEQEREARDEVEAKRARIAEALLYDTPGSRIDAFTRAARGRIERRLRKFGFLEGDAGANFRSLVRDLAGVGASARYGVLLRAIWAYRGQLRLILLAVIAFAVAFALHWLRSLGGEETLLGHERSVRARSGLVEGARRADRIRHRGAYRARIRSAVRQSLARCDFLEFVVPRLETASSRRSRASARTRRERRPSRAAGRGAAGGGRRREPTRRNPRAAGGRGRGAGDASPRGRHSCSPPRGRRRRRASLWARSRAP